MLYCFVAVAHSVLRPLPSSTPERMKGGRVGLLTCRFFSPRCAGYEFYSAFYSLLVPWLFITLTASIPAAERAKGG